MKNMDNNTAVTLELENVSNNKRGHRNNGFGTVQTTIYIFIIDLVYTFISFNMFFFSTTTITKKKKINIMKSFK